MYLQITGKIYVERSSTSRYMLLVSLCFCLCLMAIEKECNNEILFLYSHSKDQTVPKLHGNMSQSCLKR